MQFKSNRSFLFNFIYYKILFAPSAYIQYRYTDMKNIIQLTFTQRNFFTDLICIATYKVVLVYITIPSLKCSI